MLDFSGKKILKVAKHDGTRMDIIPKRIPQSEIDQFNRTMDELTRRLNRTTKPEEELTEKELKIKPISMREYTKCVLSMIVKDYREEDFIDFEIQEITMILEEINKLREHRTEEEKKIQ